MTMTALAAVMASAFLSACDPLTSFVLVQYQIDSHNTKLTILDTTMAECARLCLTNKWCKGVNFKTGLTGGQCNLKDKAPPFAVTTLDARWAYLIRTSGSPDCDYSAPREAATESSSMGMGDMGGMSSSVSASKRDRRRDEDLMNLRAAPEPSATSSGLSTGSTPRQTGRRVVVANMAAFVVVVAVIVWRRKSTNHRNTGVKGHDHDDRNEDDVVVDESMPPDTKTQDVDEWFQSLSFKLMSSSNVNVDDTDENMNALTIAWPPSPPRLCPASPPSPRRRIVQVPKAPLKSSALSASSGSTTTPWVTSPSTPTSPPRQTSSSPTSPRRRFISNGLAYQPSDEIVRASEWMQVPLADSYPSTSSSPPRRVPSSPRKRFVQNVGANDTVVANQRFSQDYTALV